MAATRCNYETPNAELAGLCNSGDNFAWEEFYRRFDGLITRTIENVFLLNGYDNIGETFVELMVSEIHLNLVTKFKNEKLLEKCEDPTGLTPWLVTVVRNAALERLIKLARIKWLPSTVAQAAMVLLGVPINEDEDETLGDVIPSDDVPVDEQLIDLVEFNLFAVMLEEFEAVPNRKQYWLLRLDIIAVLQLEPDEMDALAEFSPLSEDQVLDVVDRMVARVEKKELKRQAAIGRAEMLRCRIERLQARLSHELTVSGGVITNQIKKLQREIERKESIRIKRLKECAQIPRPAQRDLGSLVGMPLSHVSTNLSRVRKLVFKQVMQRITRDENTNSETGLTNEKRERKRSAEAPD